MSRNSVSSGIIEYFYQFGRIYPWRKERTPFKVYLSEVLLQRTRADQVIPVYNELLNRFPTVEQS